VRLSIRRSRRETPVAGPLTADVGAATLVKSTNPDTNPNQIESILKRTASVPDGYGKAYYGAGFIDPVAALQQ